MRIFSDPIRRIAGDQLVPRMAPPPPSETMPPPLSRAAAAPAAAAAGAPPQPEPASTSALMWRRVHELRDHAMILRYLAAKFEHAPSRKLRDALRSGALAVDLQIAKFEDVLDAVSYTHLTLPTILLV